MLMSLQIPLDLNLNQLSLLQHSLTYFLQRPLSIKMKSMMTITTGIKNFRESI